MIRVLLGQGGARLRTRFSRTAAALVTGWFRPLPFSTLPSYQREATIKGGIEGWSVGFVFQECCSEPVSQCPPLDTNKTDGMHGIQCFGDRGRQSGIPQHIDECEQPCFHIASTGEAMRSHPMPRSDGQQ